MCSRRAKNIGTQSGNPDLDDMTNTGDDDPDEQLRNFYFSLPRPQQLRSIALSRIHHQKVKNYVDLALDDLVKLSQETEQEDEQRRLREKDRLQQQFKPQPLDRKRLESADFVETRLNLPLKDYLQGIHRSWTGEIALLEADRKTKTLGYKPRTKVIRTPLLTNDGVEWVTHVQQKLQDVQNNALEKKISASRVRDIRSELSDFDLLNRPTHFLPLDRQDHLLDQSQTQTKFRSNARSFEEDAKVLDGSRTARAIYAHLPSLISKQSLETVLRKDTYFGFSEEPQIPDISCKPEHVLDVDEAINDLKKMPKTKSFDIDLDPKPNMDRSDDSMFELTCLRDLVDITEGSGWESKEG